MFTLMRDIFGGEVGEAQGQRHTTDGVRPAGDNRMHLIYPIPPFKHTFYIKEAIVG